MPQKSSSRTRTWGTRFDPLPSSPPSSPPKGEVSAIEATLALSATEPTLVSLKRKEEKMPHDASVFVGSLPSNIDQQDLTRMLSEHLSEHAEVKNIKVIRDTKGGVCAFVQCEDASSAATLIHTLHSTAPKPFLGRILRYEPARAFRTLLISYRTPMQIIPANHGNTDSNVPDANCGKVELDLPYAMRLWRPRNSKFLSLLYNAEAREVEDHATSQAQYTGDSVGDTGLFLQPVSFDAETIHKMSAHFGPLEYFGLYKAPRVSTSEQEDDVNGNEGDEFKSYPSPHDVPRTATMDPGCWEIKWDHRDDCVSALMTLRRVPHLTVTWAHQPGPLGFDQHSPYQNHRFSHSSAAPYPFHVQDRPRQSHRDAPDSPTFSHPHSRQTSATPPFNVSLQTRQDNAEGLVSSDPSAGPDPGNDGRSMTQPHTQLIRDPNPASSVPLFQGKDDKAESPSGARIEWTEMDFPPLGDPKGERKAECGVWGEKKPPKAENEDAERTPDSFLSLLTTTPATAEQLVSLGETTEASTRIYQEEEQELDMPPTPGFGMSPITPKTPGSLFPTTPTSTGGDLQSLSFKSYDSKENPSYYSDTNRVERELDPTTLFVGGLEMFGPGAWDEEKVGNFFARFGGVENVKVVRPLNSRAAFAFVKFNNTESPARAVFEEHNRVYEGRAMRVQLRDCNPHRGSWRYGRGRGRYPHQPLGSQRRYAEPVDNSGEREYSDGDQHQEVSTSGQYDDNSTSREVEQYVPAFASLSDGNRDTTSELDLSSRLENTPQKSVEEHSADNPHGEPSEPHHSTSHRSSPEPSATTGETPSSEAYREWYEPTSEDPTPPPSSFGSSAPGSAPGMSYHMANSGYYPPPPWMQPFAQQMPYAAPYFGSYPGYAIPSQHMPASQAFASPAGSEASGPAQSHWPPMSGMYSSYIPYPGYPARTSTVDQSQPRQSQQPASQAPLLPTGFIQNEQGTLVAVYHPEALDQYMATQHAPPPLSQPQTQNLQAWPQYPQPQPYPFPTPAPHMMSLPSRTYHAPPQPGAHIGWAPGQSSVGFPPSQHLHPHPIYAAQNLNMQNTVPTFRGAHPDMTRQPGASPVRRQQPGRRDQQTAYNPNRNNHSRPFSHRQPRGGIQAGYSNHGEAGSQPTPSRSSQFNAGAGDWNQGAAGR